MEARKEKGAKEALCRSARSFTTDAEWDFWNLCDKGFEEQAQYTSYKHF